MPTKTISNRKFDARPDRIDYRDRPYNPPLVSLPEQFPDPELISQYFPDYTETHKLILDQENEGACTGFGLAAVINYLLWKKHIDEIRAHKKKHLPAYAVVKVSQRMLYQMAKIYDEWPGEDYEGSSCRGAMKGWHRHGVCKESLWPYKSGRFLRPKTGWLVDAAQRPLGAYYRINKDSIADMQAAIHEVGAIYVSAMVHKGWFLPKASTLPIIRTVSGETGGHAFAVVGYTPQGFIVQNSWGKDWGYLGFAVMTYEDWVQHGTDAWVAVLGAPMEIQPEIQTARTRSSTSLRDLTANRAEWFWRSDSTAKAYDYQNEAVQPLSESRAYEYTVVLGNNGRPLNRFIDLQNEGEAVKEVVVTMPQQWLAEQNKPKVAIYAHGGLNDEEASIKRIRVLAPYFLENNIYPLFVTWRTGFMESIAGIIGDAIEKYFLPSRTEPYKGWLTEIQHKLQEAKDRSIEAACEKVLVKPIWIQMKQNAFAGALKNAGLDLIIRHLATLKKQIPDLEIHLLGHSAGSIVHGHLLGLMGNKKLQAETCTLFAPACTVRFALETYGKALRKKVINEKNLHFNILSDEREQDDSVGPYGKSLLYLVSRALEDVHKMPILGMEGVWHEIADADDMWIKDSGEADNKDIKEWRGFGNKLKESGNVDIHSNKLVKIVAGADKDEFIPIAHGSFDNDIEVISSALKRILGGDLSVRLENLKGF